MKDDKELFEALLAGKILVNADGDQARFVENGFLNNNWNFSHHKDWEIKPEPMEFWVNVRDCGVVDLCTSKDNAIKIAGSDVVKTIKVREVPDEN